MQKAKNGHIICKLIGHILLIEKLHLIITMARIESRKMNSRTLFRQYLYNLRRSLIPLFHTYIYGKFHQSITNRFK